MFRRKHHKDIAAVLSKMNSSSLMETQCFFAGGTAISLQLNEYRESVDIDFLCSDKEGYKKIRSEISSGNAEFLFGKEIDLPRELKVDRHGIRGRIFSNESIIKVEIASVDSSIKLSGEYNYNLNVPVLSQSDLFVQKILDNADRGINKSYTNRDIIDLCMMSAAWGGIPVSALRHAVDEYGSKAIARSLMGGLSRIRDADTLTSNMRDMRIDDPMRDVILLSAERVGEFVQGFFKNSLKMSPKELDL